MPVVLRRHVVVVPVVFKMEDDTANRITQPQIEFDGTPGSINTFCEKHGVDVEGCATLTKYVWARYSEEA